MDSLYTEISFLHLKSIISQIVYIQEEVFVTGYHKKYRLDWNRPQTEQFHIHLWYQREQACQLFGPSSSLAQFISLKKAMLRRRQPRSCLAFRPFPSPPCNSYYCIIWYDWKQKVGRRSIDREPAHHNHIHQPTGRQRLFSGQTSKSFWEGAKVLVSTYQNTN